MKEINDELIKKLAIGIVTFTYNKKNSELRTAVGTQCLDLIPVLNHPKTIGTLNSSTNITYYDFVKQNWRSLKTENIVEIKTFVENGTR